MNYCPFSTEEKPSFQSTDWIRTCGQDSQGLRPHPLGKQTFPRSASPQPRVGSCSCSTALLSWQQLHWVVPRYCSSPVNVTHLSSGPRIPPAGAAAVTPWLGEGSLALPAAGPLTHHPPPAPPQTAQHHAAPFQSTPPPTPQSLPATPQITQGILTSMMPPRVQIKFYEAPGMPLPGADKCDADLSPGTQSSCHPAGYLPPLTWGPTTDLTSLFSWSTPNFR